MKQGEGFDIWRRLCEEQGWDFGSQLDMLESVIGNLEAWPVVAAHAQEAADFENQPVEDLK